MPGSNGLLESLGTGSIGSIGVGKVSYWAGKLVRIQHTALIGQPRLKFSPTVDHACPMGEEWVKTYAKVHSSKKPDQLPR